MSIFEVKLRVFLESELMVEIDEVDRDTHLFTDGYVDSFSLLCLVKFLEESSNIRLTPEDLTLDNFDSIARISGFIENKLSG
jgi:acyl carrier protein